MADTVVTVILRARDEASSALKGVSGEMQSVALAGGVLMGVSAGVAAALTGIAVHAGANADELRVLGQQSGQSTEDISRLKFAADQLDTSLPAVGNAIRFMNRNLYEARTAGSEAQKSFQGVGFSAAELGRGLGPPNEAFLKIVDRLNAVEDPGTRAALTLKIFGRGAAEILPLINEGSAAIRAMEERSDALGATISNTAGVLGDEYGDAMKEAKAVTDGLTSQIAVSLLPELTNLVHGFTDAAVAANKFSARNPELARAVLDTATQLGILGAAITTFLAVVPLLRAGLASMGIEMAALAAAGGPITLAIVAFTALLFIVNKVRAEAEKPLKVTIQTNAKDAEAELERLTALRGEQVRKLRAAEAEESRLVAGGVTEGAAGAPLTDKESALVNARRDADQARQQIGKLDESIGKAGEALKAFDKGSEGAFDGTTEGAKKAKSALDEFLEALDKAAHPDIDLAGALKVPDAKLIRVPTPEAPEVDETQPRKIDALEQIKPQLTITNQAALELLATFEQFGLPIDGLLERLAVIGPEITEIQAIGLGLTEALGSAMQEAFNPLKVGLEGVGQAVGNLRQGFDNAFDNLGQKILSGQLATLKFETAMRGLIRATQQFIVELGIAILKAAILKAIGFGLFSAGGGVSSAVTNDHPWGLARGGPAPERARGFSDGGPIYERTRGYSQGGPVTVLQRIAGYASGGAVQHLAGALTAAAIFASPVHAAGGLALAGGPSFTDTIPAMLSAGEFVVANDGAKTGTSITGGLVRGLDTVREIIERVSAAPAQDAAAAGAPLIGTVVVQAMDSSSVKNQVRQGGEISRQIERAAELGRWRP